MKTYANASQKQSFEDQLARGEYASASPTCLEYSYGVPSRFFRHAGIQQPEVEGMTPEAVRSKIRNENLKNATRLQPPFPAAVQDDHPNELPLLR